MESRTVPSVMALTRQNVPTFDRDRCGPAAGARRGGYVLLDAEGGAPEVILVASGSEVATCVEAHARLAARGVRARVVSMPCTTVFDAQPREYRDAVLPPSVRRRVAVEMGSALGWGDYVGLDGTVLAMRSFGESGPAAKVIAHFGFTADAIADAAERTKR
jgi:transketolase